MTASAINPFYQSARGPPQTAHQQLIQSHEPVYARLPIAPRNASPVPHLTSLYHFTEPVNTATAVTPAIAAANSSAICSFSSARKTSSTR
jgi:hypothetical protein